MKKLRHPILSLGLITCFLFVGGVLTSLGAAHTLHHANHKAPTHSNIVCSWMCAAGQAADTVEPIFQSPHTDLGTIESSIGTLSVKAPARAFFSRGPPIL